MNWINLSWPMATGAFLTMALVHLWTGLRKSGGRPNVLFAISAICAAIYSWFELEMTQAGSPAEFLARIRWLDLAADGVAVCLDTGSASLCSGVTDNSLPALHS